MAEPHQPQFATHDALAFPRRDELDDVSQGKLNRRHCTMIMGDDSLQFLADEQSALRRVATLVAGRAQPTAVFDAVCEELGRLIGATITNLAHFTPDGMNLTMAGWSVHGKHVPAGTRLPLDGQTINVLVHRTRAPSRIDSYENAEGELAALLLKLGIRSEVAAPVVVDGSVWAALIGASDKPEPIPLATGTPL